MGFRLATSDGRTEVVMSERHIAFATKRYVHVEITNHPAKGPDHDDQGE
jgi:hypothetical protein